MKCSKLLLFFLFSAFKKQKTKMIELIHFLHPFPIASCITGYLPLPELALIVWELHRGGEKSHFKNCSACNNFAQWCIDEMWRKWNHEGYEKFHMFIYKLIKTSRFDNFCLNISKKNIKHFNVYFEGWTPGLICIM